MMYFFKTRNRLNLDKPTNQSAEILFELLNNVTASRSELMETTGCLNITAIISRLRLDHEIEIKCNFKETTNKHGRPVKFGIYQLIDKNDGLKKYNTINKR
ncbi:hypothetical protein UFOVP638_18 [uncultured Caudovirales phage]|uniref:Helix-turn-helix domain containing protein n=1 Tax=uncultured Caudovirales phage TaxID=2100421 RepID=A0A6J5NDW5_9CAUD|nr:hypothetical protein UFOVP638_18 [uncultured Caudovirales phage]